MATRSGSADLPLHGGSVPSWLASRMARLGRVIVEALVLHHGRDEVLRRLAHPFWFQSLGCVMGMDWHSSGITTSVVGALKRGLAPVADELGIYVCGGRGKHSRRTPAELAEVAARTGLDGMALARASRLVAKVDNTAVQDGYQLYLHGFVVTADGKWSVIQQGMDPERRQARRYHWLSEGLTSFVEEPHAAIEGENRGEIVNLTDRRAHRARAAQLELVQEGPDRVLQALARIEPQPRPRREPEPLLPHLVMPARHQVVASDVVSRRLHATLTAAAEHAPRSFEELLLVPGVGPRTVAAVAAVGEVIHGAPSRFTDPARFSFAHGGKDGHPFPVPTRVYDATLRVLRQAVEAAKLGNADRLEAIRQLDRQARHLERTLELGGEDIDVAAVIVRERRMAPVLGGKSTRGPSRPGRRGSQRKGAGRAPGSGTGAGKQPAGPSGQLDLFGRRT